MLKLQMVMEKNAANDLEDGILLQMEKKTPIMSIWGVKITY